jgi:hypothetical protein
MVSLSRTLPPFTVFYGASCSGLHGSWFFNAVEGGGNDALRPSYALRWTFPTSSGVANPDGHVVISSTDTTQITLTITGGEVKLQGTRKPNVKVSDAGTLTVALAGSSTAPDLKFTETGLTRAESQLGLVSPFNVGGQPLTVPIKLVKTMAGC